MAALAGMIMILPGCPLSPEEDNGGGPDPETRLDDPTTPELALTRLAQVWEQKRFQEYSDLLHDSFRFYIRDDDADAFPWLANDFWGRTEELQFASNMFDSNFSGTNPPVDSIEWMFNILNQRNLTDAQGNVIAVEITTDATIQVLTGPNDGFRSDTRFLFEVVDDPNQPGFFQIQRQQEVEKL
ncbi:MAG: hypothetical protein HKN12_09610 [Gemmatimonadetes bacterium]|nr:hypothetical protein [Gemmatimonadota bacterium]